MMTVLLIVCTFLLVCNSYVSIRNYFLLSLLDNHINDLFETLNVVAQHQSPEVGLDKRLYEIQTAKFALVNKRIK